MKRWNNRTIFSIIITFSLLVVTYQVLAYEMSSDNYRLWETSINVGGLESQTSVSYRLRETIGEVTVGEATSTSYKLKMGYQPMLETYISISAPTSTNLGSIGGLSGGTASSSFTVTVTTDSPAGYNLSVQATSTPAMIHTINPSYSFADYTPATSTIPDYDWLIGSANSEFGFASYNTNSQIQKYKNDGNNCNSGSNITDEKCWYPFSTSTETIANKTSRTDISGENTKINLQAAINTSSGYQEAGNYQATIISTAIAN